jgi:hypothetical protein
MKVFKGNLKNKKMMDVTLSEEHGDVGEQNLCDVIEDVGIEATSEGKKKSLFF